jgi:hypothetical protein
VAAAGATRAAPNRFRLTDDGTLLCLHRRIHRTTRVACDFLVALNGVGALRPAPAKREILAPSFVERDYHVVGRHLGRCGDAGVDVFQECQPRLLRPPFDEGEIEDNQVVGIRS